MARAPLIRPTDAPPTAASETMRGAGPTISMSVSRHPVDCDVWSKYARPCQRTAIRPSFVAAAWYHAVPRPSESSVGRVATTSDSPNVRPPSRDAAR